MAPQLGGGPRTYVAAVADPADTAKGGGIIWYGGGKLAADLTLPKLRHRWLASGAEHGVFPGRGLSSAAAHGGGHTPCGGAGAAAPGTAPRR